MPTSLLIVDDEPKMSGVLARMLARDGYDVDWKDDPLKALELLSGKNYDIVLCDLRMPGMSGIDLLEKAKRKNPAVDFVMMTAYATPQTAVESLKKGAIDYLIKPFAIEELKSLIKRIETARAGLQSDELDKFGAKEVTTSERKAQTVSSSLDIIAESPAMKDVINRIKKVAASQSSVLLRGESGSGKEVMAKLVHNLSKRADKPLVVVNCGAIPENLMESELFGHVKGSFTGAIENRKGYFETADSGTIFLDEIGDMPLHLQVKLLRVIQEGEVQRVGDSQIQKVDVRIIAATHKNLEEAVAKGEFRQDLYYRLNVIPVCLPPLRERKEDLRALTEFFIKKYSVGEQSKLMSPAALDLLMSYQFPGNIRELENAIEHSVVLSESDSIEPGDLPFQIQNFYNKDEFKTSGSFSETAGNHLDEVERKCILTALEKTKYNYTRAAAHLGITRRTLGYRIQKHDLEDYIIKQKQELKK